ncbi:MAG: discoidin domain-containing protein [bacterium]
MRAAALVLLLVLLIPVGGCLERGPVRLGEPAAWTAHPADGVQLALSNDGGALRLDFAFTGGGYAIARREVDLDLPASYVFRFRLRGEAPANHLEFKLVDASGENVWWHVERDVVWPQEWRTVTIKKRRIGFAWGPVGGGEIAHVAAIEFAITAGSGGEGTVWIEGLELVPMPEVTGPAPEPVATATSQESGCDPGLVLDGDPGTWWAPAADDPAPALTLDLGRPREFGGVTLTWAADRNPADYVIEGSDDGEAWTVLQTVTGGNGGIDDLFLPESEWRRLRLALGAHGGGLAPALAEFVLQPLEWSATREAFFMDIAARARRGLYPRGFLGEPTAWTVVGADHDAREGLLGADGALEAGPGGFSVEPFLWTGGRLLTWQDAVCKQRLAEGNLPVPTVIRDSGPWRLVITALGAGEPGQSGLLARYRLENRGAAADSATLFLAVRPFQVNPPVQFLNVRGGFSRIGTIARDGRTLLVDGEPRVILQRVPDGFGASAFAGGMVVPDFLENGRLPDRETVDDPFGAASASAAYRLALEPGASAVLDAWLPLYPDAPGFEPGDGNRTLLEVEAGWRSARDRVTITGPPAAAEALQTLKAQVGWILVNRAEQRIQPGARSYARSWIRDGALTGVALLRMGHPEAVREFLEWYAPHQYDNGKIPCVVDWRGADPVPEHDSTGEFIHLASEYYRYTGDRAALEAMWPRILLGVEYLESLLDQRRTPEYEGSAFFGILPPSISHEGYSAKPMHSYWDDFWALRGLKDAARLAQDFEPAQVADLAAKRDRFAADLKYSVAAAMGLHGIDYVPGCADLGDFDATSTTIALDPAAAEDLLPPGALVRTFDRYWDFFAGRRDGEPWEAFTPYEIRTIGTFVRLGRRDQVQELLAFFLGHRTPVGWRQWAEVVGSDPDHARFIGDMPHTWVGSDYVRSVLDLFVYEDGVDEPDGPALVLGAGVPAEWLRGKGIRVGGLPTPYGSISYRLWQEGNAVILELEPGAGPPGGFVLDPPLPGTPVRIAGDSGERDGRGRVVVREAPVRVRWEF